MNAIDPLAESAAPAAGAASAEIAAPAPIVVRCWRCDHRIFDLELEPDRRIPAGVAVKRKCEKCKAINRIPLDKLLATAYDRGNGLTE